MELTPPAGAEECAPVFHDALDLFVLNLFFLTAVAVLRGDARRCSELELWMSLSRSTTSAFRPRRAGIARALGPALPDAAVLLIFVRIAGSEDGTLWRLLPSGAEETMDGGV